VKPERQESTLASDENRDSRNRPLPRLGPAIDAYRNQPFSLRPGRAWDRMLADGRPQQVATVISNLARFRRLRQPAPATTAHREPVRQFRGLGIGIQTAGLAAALALGWRYGLGGSVAGLVVVAASVAVGRATSKPQRCAHCKTPLATAKVRVCPGCAARLIGSAAGLPPDARKARP
jgi:hypothetical protein